MPMHDDGDIVRACGFLAIYFGNLEEELNDLFELICKKIKDDGFVKKFRFSERVKYIRKAINAASLDTKLRPYDYHRIKNTLDISLSFAQKRNEIIHSSLIGGVGGTSILKMKDGSERLISSSEVYDLANDIFQLGSSILSIRFLIERIDTEM